MNYSVAGSQNLNSGKWPEELLEIHQRYFEFGITGPHNTANYLVEVIQDPLSTISL